MSDDTLFDELEDKGMEATLLQRQADRIALPDDPGAWLDDYERFAETLPDELPQKRTIARYVRIARAAMREGRDSHLRLFMLKTKMEGEAAKHDKWSLGVQRQFTETADKRNRALKPQNEARWQRWRDEADKIRREYPGKKMSKTYLAETIKRRLNLTETVRTIRNRL